MTFNTQKPTYTGGALTPQAATYPAGDSFVNNGFEWLHIANPTGAGITITADAPGVDNFGFSGNALDKAVVVPAGATMFAWGPFPMGRHNDANGKVQLTYSATGLMITVMGR